MNKPYTTQIIITDTETGKVISEVVVDAIGQIDIHGRSQPAKYLRVSLEADQLIRERL